MLYFGIGFSIHTGWSETIVNELNEISLDFSKELQIETSLQWNKGSYILDLHGAPPTRLLSLAIPLAAWLGWIMREKHGDKGPLSVEEPWRRMEEAYSYGVDLSRKRKVP